MWCFFVSNLIGLWYNHIRDFGDVAITDGDKDFVYLLENSDEEIGRDFGLKVLKYYNHKNISAVIWKSDLNDIYYPIEQTICGKNLNDEKMFNDGLNKIKQFKGENIWQ